jgi:anti-sigma regulatory factor (Ser/Thr protein kinase)|uniref:ATP-binding protein n=1 Tax=Desulfobacca acetoxidans TaxID=60893 RepID=A0A7C3SJC3_9BACT
MVSRLAVSNRQENQRILLEFVRKWGEDHGLSPSRRDTLEQAVSGVFQHLVTHAYQPGQPGSVVVVLEDKGPRLRLMFEDDAPPHNPTGFNAIVPGASANPNLIGVRRLADGLIYYRTADQKNRLVLFLTM